MKATSGIAQQAPKRYYMIGRYVVRTRRAGYILKFGQTVDTVEQAVE